MPEPVLTFGERLAAERALLNAAEWAMPVALGLAPTIAIVGLLQLALRHPGVTKRHPSEKIAREFIAGVERSLLESGFIEHATLVRLGDDPASDQPA